MKLPAILKYPNYSRLYYAGLTSELGSFITETALMLYIFDIGNQDKTLMGITRTVFLVCLTLGGLVGGPLGEKFNRRRILIFCEIVRVPVIIFLILFQSVPVVIVCDGLVAFFTGIFRPSRQALVNDLVPQKDIKKANAMFGSTFAVLHLIGPLIGAMVYASFKGISQVLVFDFLTYVLGIFLLMRITYRPPKEHEEERNHSLLTQLKDGFRFSAKRIDILSIYITSALTGLSIGVLIPLLLPFVHDVLGKGERAYGVLMALFGVGGIIGGWLSEKLSTNFRLGQICVIAALLEPIMMNLFVRTTLYPISLLIFFTWGVVVFVRITSQMNYISDTVETRFLSRCHSLLEMSFVTPSIAGGMLVSLIGNKYGTYDTLFWSAIFFIVTVYSRLLLPEMKSLYNGQRKTVDRDERSFDQMKGES